jgi:Cu/Ag efflux pump CusA
MPLDLILWENGFGSEVMKPISAPIVSGMITVDNSCPHMGSAFFVIMK